MLPFGYTVRYDFLEDGSCYWHLYAPGGAGKVNGGISRDQASAFDRALTASFTDRFREGNEESLLQALRDRMLR